MDRRESLRIVVLLLAAALSIAGIASAHALSFEENFDSITTGIYPPGGIWTPLSGMKPAYVVEGVFTSPTKSFRLDSNPFSPRADCVVLAEVPDRLSYETAVCLDAGSGQSAAAGFVGLDGGAVAMWNFFALDAASGRLLFYGQDEVDLAPYTRGTWVTVRADLDYNSLTAALWAWVWLDGDPVPARDDLPVYAAMDDVVTDRWGVGAPATSSFSNVVYFDDVRLWEPDSTLVVGIDITPGGNPNTINLRSRGLLPVCVFSSETFDATRIDPATCALAGAPVAVRTKRFQYLAHPEDIDGDGLTDMMLHFETQQLDPDQLQDDYAVLVGSTLDGQDFLGSDEISLVGPRFRTRLRR